MLWAHLLVLPAIWSALLVSWPKWRRGIALVALFFSGFVTLLGGLNSEQHGYSIATISEIDSVREATRALPITATIAAEPIYNHPLLLAGRKLVVGYSGHVTSHGLDSREQEAQLDALMNGGSDWRIRAAALHARYLFFGQREAAHWPDSQQKWRDGARVVTQGDTWTLYDLETPAVAITPE
jgi:hypothetical protein